MLGIFRFITLRSRRCLEHLLEFKVLESIALTCTQWRSAEAGDCAIVLVEIDAGACTICVAFYARQAFTTLKRLYSFSFTCLRVAWCVDDLRAVSLAGIIQAVFEAAAPGWGYCNGLQMAVYGLVGIFPSGTSGA